MNPAVVFAKRKTALITGSASGVGLAVAKLCKSHGMNLALVDNNKDLLSRAKDELSGGDAVTETYDMDVSRLDQWGRLKDSVTKSFGEVDLLVLNAGIGLKSGWDDPDYFHKVSVSSNSARASEVNILVEEIYTTDTFLL